MYTEEQAAKKAVEEFEKKGLNCIEYKNGGRVNIADYTSMAVRTANQRAYMVGEGEFRKAIGETLVIISRHTTSCELCKPWEGKVLIDDVYSGGTQADGDYMLLSEAMAQGLYHPRCRHGLGTYYPELEDINKYQQKNDANSALTDKAKNDNIISNKITGDKKTPEEAKRLFNSKISNDASQLETIGDTGIRFSSKQLGHKIGRHAEDFGLDPSNPEHRDTIINMINTIISDSDEVRVGNWRGQPDLVEFYIKGEDVVVVNSKHEFITILKGGINNERIKNARKR